MEYELVRPMELGSVTMTIPFPPGCDAPRVTCEDGEANYSARNNALVWAIPLISKSNPSGTLEFAVAGARPGTARRAPHLSAHRCAAPRTRPRAHAGVDPSAFFPISVDFTSSKTFCEMEIGDVLNVETREPIRFSSLTSLTVEQYSIV